MEVDGSMMTAYLMAIAVALIIFYYLMAKDDGYPPGPFTFPLVGNLPQMLMAGSIVKFMDQCRRKYGNAFTLELGGNKQVVISGFEVMRALLVKNAKHTSNRATKSMSQSIQDYVVKDGTPGLLWSPYPQWKTLRSFAISTLKEEGMGKASMEPHILGEVEQYISYFIEPHLNEPINISRSLSQATYNTISLMLLGKRFDYNDKGHIRMVSAIHDVIQLSLVAAIIGNLPFGKLFNKFWIKRECCVRKDVLWPLLQQYINEHKESLDNDNPRDITDRFLIHSMSSREEDKGCFSEANAKVFSYNIYMAGTETTATALQWAILYMCLNPNVKEKVQLEIDEQIGSVRAATCKDRVRMPYTDAVLHETLRKANISSFALPHTLEKDISVDQLKIPAGADLMLNMASVLYDETVFEEPEKFKPERYLTGDIALKRQRTIPFGIGRRACLGESLAKMEMFLFFVTLLQRYNMCIPDGETATDTPVESMASEPKPFNVIFSTR